jgi:hypothetical protein
MSQWSITMWRRSKKRECRRRLRLVPAWTLDRFQEVGREVQKSGATSCALTSYARFPRTFLLLMQALGGTFCTEGGTRANLSSPDGIAAISWLAATFKEGPSPDSPDVLFAHGATALHIGGRWQLPLSIPTSMMFTFMWRWNDFQRPLIATPTPDMYTVQVAPAIWVEARMG